MSKEHYESANVIIKALVQGTDPATGEPFPPESILNRSDVLRALLTASVAIENVMSRAARRAQLPSNVGKSWSREEEASLVAAFRSGDSVTTIADRHARTVCSIESRLGMLGLLTPISRNSFTLDQQAGTKGDKDE